MYKHIYIYVECRCICIFISMFDLPTVCIYTHCQSQFRSLYQKSICMYVYIYRKITIRKKWRCKPINVSMWVWAKTSTPVAHNLPTCFSGILSFL